MVILLARNGQLCNRLFTTAAFMAHAIENNYKLVCANFDDYLPLFDNLQAQAAQHQIIFLPSANGCKAMCHRLVAKLAYKLEPLMAKLGIRPYRLNGAINTNDFTEAAITKTLYVQGWPFWDVPDFVKHAATIRKLFTPHKKYREQAATFLSGIDKKYDVLVGVHVRRGDYAQHINGRFFFSIETYQQKMQAVYRQLKAAGKNPVFVVCSNEKVAAGWPVEYPYYVSNLDGMTDLVMLSSCNYIFGPPSTYSMWASFYGQVPSLNFFSEEDQLPIENFSVIIAPSTYANGTELVDVYERYNQ